MGLLDRNGLYGPARMHTSTKVTNVKAHVGAEITVPEDYSNLPVLVEKRQVFKIFALSSQKPLRVPKNAP